MQPETPARHVFVSPHLDDVALSCGGTMHRLASRGHDVLAVTVFAASPDNSALTPIARELAERWETPGDPVAIRRAEDRAACAVLGAKAIHLAWADCVYRVGSEPGVGLYASEEALFGEVHPDERDLPEAIAASLSSQTGQPGATAVYAPLGAGHHVDHQLVRAACRLMAERGYQVSYYEDYPYADDPVAVRDARRACAPCDWSAAIVPLDDADLDAKQRAVACYASQINTFWRDAAGRPDLDAMRRALEAYARRTGGPGLAERYWTPAPTSAKHGEKR